MTREYLHVWRGEILPPNGRNTKDLERLQNMVTEWRLKYMEKHQPDIFLNNLGVHNTELYDRPVDMNADFVPPNFKLYDIETKTNMKIVGLIPWKSEETGQPVPHLAVPLLKVQ